MLDHLRGLAALAVCLFHFSEQILPPGDPVRRVGSFGWLGVHIFFVVSGFVIPYSLQLRTYRLRDAGQFVARRLKRLEPPYFACIAAVIGLHYLSSLALGFRGEALHLDWRQLLAHIGYSNAILGYPWLNPIFWTLAIEFQYYLFIALAFPLFFQTGHRPAVVAGAYAAVLGLAILGGRNPALLPHWLPLFLMGTAVAQYALAQVSGREFALYFASAMAVCALTIGAIEASVGMLTVIMIFLFRSRPLPAQLNALAWVGTISYSLYLMHVPFGGRVVNLAKRLPESLLLQYAAVAAAFAVSIAIALLFYKLIEAPSHRWAKGRPKMTS